MASESDSDSSEGGRKKTNSVIVRRSVVQVVQSRTSDNHNVEQHADRKQSRKRSRDRSKHRSDRSRSRSDSLKRSHGKKRHHRSRSRKKSSKKRKKEKSTRRSSTRDDSHSRDRSHKHHHKSRHKHRKDSRRLSMSSSNSHSRSRDRKSGHSSKHRRRELERNNISSSSKRTGTEQVNSSSTDFDNSPQKSSAVVMRSEVHIKPLPDDAPKVKVVEHFFEESVGVWRTEDSRLCSDRGQSIEQNDSLLNVSSILSPNASFSETLQCDTTEPLPAIVISSPDHGCDNEGVDISSPPLPADLDLDPSPPSPPPLPSSPPPPAIDILSPDHSTDYEEDYGDDTMDDTLPAAAAAELTIQTADVTTVMLPPYNSSSDKQQRSRSPSPCNDNSEDTSFTHERNGSNSADSDIAAAQLPVPCNTASVTIKDSNSSPLYKHHNHSHQPSPHTQPSLVVQTSKDSERAVTVSPVSSRTVDVSPRQPAADDNTRVVDGDVESGALSHSYSELVSMKSSPTSVTQRSTTNNNNNNISSSPIPSDKIAKDLLTAAPMDSELRERKSASSKPTKIVPTKDLVETFEIIYSKIAAKTASKTASQTTTSSPVQAESDNLSTGTPLRSTSDLDQGLFEKAAWLLGGGATARLPTWSPDQSPSSDDATPAAKVKVMLPDDDGDVSSPSPEPLTPERLADHKVWVKVTMSQFKPDAE
jgi:hypothetical protein